MHPTPATRTCTPFASLSTAFEANSWVTVLAPLMPNFAHAPIAKPSVMADLREVIMSLTTPAHVHWQRQKPCCKGAHTIEVPDFMYGLGQSLA
jgi:hypothetical protein